jgi:hypothetical protein
MLLPCLLIKFQENNSFHDKSSSYERNLNSFSKTNELEEILHYNSLVFSIIWIEIVINNFLKEMSFKLCSNFSEHVLIESKI